MPSSNIELLPALKNATYGFILIGGIRNFYSLQRNRGFNILIAFTRYLFPYIGLLMSSLAVYFVIVLTFNGTIVFLSFLLFLGIGILSLPYMMWSDYKKLKRFVYKFVNPTKDSDKALALVEGLADTAAQRFGIPRFLADVLVTRTRKKIRAS